MIEVEGKFIGDFEAEVEGVVGGAGVFSVVNTVGEPEAEFDREVSLHLTRWLSSELVVPHSVLDGLEETDTLVLRLKAGFSRVAGVSAGGPNTRPNKTITKTKRQINRKGEVFFCPGWCRLGRGFENNNNVSSFFT